MFIDIGASSREEALEWGVLPGDMIVPHFEFTVMNNENSYSQRPGTTASAVRLLLMC